jgi:hypothetical protein
MSIEIVEIRSSSDEPSIVSINQGPSGPPNILTIGTVESGASAFANITGSSPSQELNLVLPKGDQGIQGIQGIQGETGETGATGAQGDRAGLKYRFDTSTSPGAPSPGHLRFNSSTLSAVTRIAIRDTDFDGTSTSALLDLIDDSTSAIKARVVIRSNSNSDTSHFNFLVTSVTDEGNHHHINGTYVSGSAFDSNEIVTFDFFVTGDKGDQGIQGIQGLQGVGPVTIADTAPTSPTDGQLWMGLTNEVLSIYSTVKARWVIPIARRMDQDAESYIDAVFSAGGTVGGEQQAAINTFFKAEKMAGRYALLKRIYLPIWGVAAPNAICMTSLTSGTFVGGVTHSSGYVSTNGTTGYFIFDQAPASLGLTTSSASIYCLVTGASAINGNTTLGGVQDSSNFSRTSFAPATSGNRNIRVFSATALTYSEADSRSVLVASRTTTTTNSAYKRTSSGFVTTINEGSALSPSVGTVQPMAYMANNNNGTFNTFAPAAAQFGAYGMGLGMTSTQAENFSSGLKTLWETCTGLALP